MSKNQLHRIEMKAIRTEAIEKIENNGRINWGKDNLYGQFLNGLYYDNSVHGGIINQKVNFITSGGLKSTDETILNNFGAAYDLTEIYVSAIKDIEISDSCYLRFKKNSAGNWVTSIIDFELIRVNENGYFEYSEDWSVKQQSEKQNYKTYKNIINVDLENDTECLMQIMTRPKQRYIKNGRKAELTKNYYPTPNYSGAIIPIQAGIKMSFFTFSEVVNGFKAGTLINLANGVPDNEEEENKILRRLKTDSADEENWGGLIVTFSDGKDREPRVSQINGNDLDKRYDASKKDVLKEIMIAHGVISPALFGVLAETMFGSNDEMETAFVLFQENYAKNRQKLFLDSVNWAQQKLNGFTGKIETNEPKLILTQSKPEEKPAATFSNEDQILVQLMKCGIDRKTIEERASLDFSLDLKDSDYLETFKKEAFAPNLTDDQKLILSMIKEGRSYSDVSKAVGKGGVYVSQQLVTLGELKLLDGWKVTPQGFNLSFNNEDFKVFYSYELKATAPKLVPGGKSRPFCETLIGLNRLYTREEIETISLNVGRDVWTYRGGWYHNPETEVNTPSCRHEWRVIITQNSDGSKALTVPPNLTIDKIKKETVSNIAKDLGLVDVKSSYGKIAGNIGGEVKFVKVGDVYKMSKSLKIDESKYKDNPEKLAQIIRHEMRHIYQSEKMGFYIKGDQMYWQNRPHISIGKYNRIINKVAKAKTKEEFDKYSKEYNELPWEKDANTYMEKLIFNQDKPFIETIEEPLMIDLIQLPEQLQK